MKEIKDYKVGDRVQILFAGLLNGQIGTVCGYHLGYDNKIAVSVQVDDGTEGVYELPTSIKPANSEIIKQRLGIK